MTKKQNKKAAIKRRILVVVPTYNEAANVRPLVNAIGSVFQKQANYTPEILFVDDDSPDNTSTIIRELQQHDEHIHLLSGSKAGLGKAYIRGIAYGLGLKSYFAVVMMDADLSHDPRDIPALLAELESGADYAIGSRYTAGGHTDHHNPLYRRLQSLVANLLAKQVVDLKVDVKDLTSGFKAIRRTSLETIPLQNITASGYVFQVSLLYEFDKRNFVIKEVPITFWPRQRGRSKLGLKDISEFLWRTYNLNPYSRLRSMLRFATVGAIGAAVNLVTLVALVQAVRLEVMVAYLIALEVSIVNNFFLNHWFTFRFTHDAATYQTAPWLAQISKLLRYNLVALGGAAIAWLVFTAMFRGLGFDYVAADVLGIGVATSWNYWLSVRLVWPAIDTPSAELHHELQEA